MKSLFLDTNSWKKLSQAVYLRQNFSLTFCHLDACRLRLPRQSSLRGCKFNQLLKYFSEFFRFHSHKEEAVVIMQIIGIQKLDVSVPRTRTVHIIYADDQAQQGEENFQTHSTNFQNRTDGERAGKRQFCSPPAAQGRTTVYRLKIIFNQANAWTTTVANIMHKCHRFGNTKTERRKRWIKDLCKWKKIRRWCCIIAGGNGWINFRSNPFRLPNTQLVRRVVVNDMQAIWFDINHAR